MTQQNNEPEQGQGEKEKYTHAGPGPGYIPDEEEQALLDLMAKHNITVEDLRELDRLAEEGMKLVEGINRNLVCSPVYNWEVHFGRYLYQIGPEGSKKGLTTEAANRLWVIWKQIRQAAKGFFYDPEERTITITCGPKGCRRCNPALAQQDLDAMLNVAESWGKPVEETWSETIRQRTKTITGSTTQAGRQLKP